MTRAPTPPLARLRLQLTLWYASIFMSILGALGVGLFLAVRHRMSLKLDESLRAATSALMRAASVRETEQTSARGVVADAVDELYVPDRSLFLFDTAGQPIKPSQAADWVREAAREAGRSGRADRDFETPDDHVVRLHAERFTGPSGKGYVAAVVADRLELESEYASLIRAFGAAAVIALLLVAGGGYILVRKSTDPIEQSMERTRRFMADAAHQLRTPITILRTRAEIAAAQDREPARDAATFQAIERETARTGEIIGELLTLARADAGERPTVRATVYLDDVVAGAVEAARALAERKQVRLEVAAFEEAKVVGDLALLRQLLLIVLDNAIKFTPAGGRVRLDVSAQNGRAAVVITDSGVGIPAADLPHVFERFYRGSAAGREPDGAGLGLAIARWIADVHGAEIDLASEPGVGTRVTLAFPAAA
ncbi:MAG TPA: HAMP domain-containing sensor histidine kinase [Gemmatimonadales bacterium]|nr:HAMP domain-containing sensor histidine kinase [Gemmatimonadales bacterium]